MATRIARFNLMFTASANQIRSVFRSLDSGFGRLSKSATSLSQGFVFVSEAIGRITNAINSVRFEIDELGKVSDRLGLESTFLQGLQLAGRLTGVSTGQINKALRDLQRRIGEFRAGMQTRAREGFNILGISPEDLRGGSFEQQIQTIIQGLSGIQSRSERAAAATRLFGSSAQDLLLVFDNDLINQSVADIREWGGLTRGQIANVEAMNDAIERFQTRLKISTAQAVSESGPAFTRFFDRLLSAGNWALNGLGKLWIGLDLAVQGFISYWVSILNELVQMFSAVLPKAVTDFSEAFRDEQRKNAEDALKAWNDIGREIPASIQDAADSVADLNDQMSDLTGQNWFNNMIQGGAARLLARDAQRFASNLRDNMVAAFSRDNPLLKAALQLTGAGVIRAGSIQAAQYESRNQAKNQITLLTRIERNTRPQQIEIVERAV